MYWGAGSGFSLKRRIKKLKFELELSLPRTHSGIRSSSHYSYTSQYTRVFMG